MRNNNWKLEPVLTFSSDQNTEIRNNECHVVGMFTEHSLVRCVKEIHTVYQYHFLHGFHLQKEVKMNVVGRERCT